MYEKWHADWKTLTFDEQFKYHLKATGKVKPLQFRKAGKFTDGATGIKFDVEEVDMPDLPPKPFVNKTQLAMIGEAVVKEMHSKDSTASKKASILSMLVGQMPDYLASKATGTGKNF